MANLLDFDKSNIKIVVGNRVRIIDSGQFYSTYDRWITKNAPEYYERWKNSKKRHKLDLIYTVVKIALHNEYEGVDLYLIANNDCVFLAGIKGIEKVWLI